MDIHELSKNGNIKGIKAALKNKKAFLSLDKDRGWSWMPEITTTYSFQTKCI
tara:strand:- start:107 stop:262 length:156 start_codon:yes stop_codon:yes gene_type:complete